MIYLPLTSQETLLSAISVARPLADVSSAQLAVLDEDSRILVVNSRWREFAIQHDFADPGFGVGANYLDVCRRAVDDGVKSVAPIADSIVEIIEGQIDKAKLFYEGWTDRRRRSNEVMLMRWMEKDQPRVIVAHWLHI